MAYSDAEEAENWRFWWWYGWKWRNSRCRGQQEAEAGDLKIKSSISSTRIQKKKVKSQQYSRVRPGTYVIPASSRPAFALTITP